jgi:hypothetical protein
MKTATMLQEFRVADVNQATTPLREILYHNAVESFLQEFVLEGAGAGRFGGLYAHGQVGFAQGFVESCSQYHGKLVATPLCHALLGALHFAFADHRPLCLSPDIIWLTLTQGLANHININAERLRRQCVRHDGQLTIVVRRDEFIKGSPENPWPGVFAEFSEHIRGYIGEAHRLIVPDFSTTGAVERAAAEVVLLDAMQAYFRYEVRTACGIPQILLEGSAEDWQTIGRRVQEWRRFDLDWWVKPLQSILDQFIAAAQGRVDRNFWNSIYKWNGAAGSGQPPYVSGWILKMFPYLNPVNKSFRAQPGTPSLCRNEWLNQAPAVRHGPGLDRFPQLPARAPFLWKYYDQEFDMEFVGGLVGIRQDPESLALRPEIGWAILDKQKITQIKAEQVAKERARVEAERAKAADREKAQVVAPRIDTLKHRFEQFFRFVCPFCGEGEEIGLWFTSKTCAGCQKTSRIVRKP